MTRYVSKQHFIEWLDSKYGKSDSNYDTAYNLELIASSYSNYADTTFVIWESTDRKDIDKLITLLNYGFLGAFDTPYDNLKASLVLFKKFIIHVDISRSNSHLEWRTNSNVDDEDDMKERLNTATAYLIKQYENRYVRTIAQLQEENQIISFACFNKWTKVLYNMTAREYLIRTGIFTEPTYRRIVHRVKTEDVKKQEDYSRKTKVQQLNKTPDNGIGLTVSELRELIKQESENSVKAYMKKQNPISLKSPILQKETENYTEQPVWDIYETALIVDVCYRMLYKGEVRNIVVRRLASSLRTRAKDNGNLKIAQLCDESTISSEISKIKFLFTDGEEGIPGANSLSKEVVSMKKQSPKVFEQLLCEALRQLENNHSSKEGEPEITENTTYLVEEQAREMKQGKISFRRNDFRNWMRINNRYKGDKIDPVVNAIDVSSEYVLNKHVYHLSFWEMNSKTEFIDISATLLEMKPFRVRVGKFINAYRRAFDIYADYMIVIESRMH